MKLVIFEDETFANFYPLTMTRPIFALRCGAKTLAEKIEAKAGRPADVLLVRHSLAAVTARDFDLTTNDLGPVAEEGALFVNGRLLADDALALALDGPDEAVYCGQTLLYVRASAATMKHTCDPALCGRPDCVSKIAGGLDRVEAEATVIDYPWNLIEVNPAQITADFHAAGKVGVHGQMHESAVIFGDPKRVYVAEGANIHPFVTLDTHGGPVTIEAGCQVHPYSRIEGPCYLGPDCVVLGAKVREGCSFGPCCRLGGEIEESILQGFSNKYHDGFLGHAYVGEWVNLGALTTNSDLKNDYSTVEVKVGGEMIDSGSTKVGAIIGDHVKTSIGTLLNTGAVVGTMCLCMAAAGPLPKFIPSFTWFVNGFVTKGFGFNKLLETAAAAMSRRKRELTDLDRDLLRHAYELTAEQRMAAVRRDRKRMLGK